MGTATAGWSNEGTLGAVHCRRNASAARAAADHPRQQFASVTLRGLAAADNMSDTTKNNTDKPVASAAHRFSRRCVTHGDVERICRQGSSNCRTEQWKGTSRRKEPQDGGDQPCRYRRYLETIAHVAAVMRCAPRLAGSFDALNRFNTICQCCSDVALGLAAVQPRRSPGVRRPRGGEG